jgi:hypothetical protein
MAKNNNAVHSATIRVTVSEQSQRLLDELAQLGIYGRNSAEVAGRFVDAALQGFVERPKLDQDAGAKRNRRNR